MREPLSGWKPGVFGPGTFVDVGSIHLTADNEGEWSIVVEEQFGYVADAIDALDVTQLAAEDAARAMVAEMAAALGGRVVWGPVCPFCSFEGADVGVDGQMQCAGCGALGVPADAADAEGVHP